MKQFTEAELQEALDAEFRAGYAVGFHDSQYHQRKKLANQRRELRRLNKKIEYLHVAFKAGAAVFNDRVAVELKMKELEKQRRAA